MVTTMICRSSLDLPRSLRGCHCWLQCLDHGAWYAVLRLTADQARDTCSWLDRHPQRTNLRVFVLSTQ